MAINLQKCVESVGISLAKHNILKAPTVRVGAIIDVSGSTRNMFSQGIIQATVSRLLAFGLTFDDNGAMDMWAFDSNFYRLDQSNRENYETFVNDQIVHGALRGKIWQTTKYAGVTNDAVNFYFRGDDTTVPVQKAVQETKKAGFLGRLLGAKDETIEHTETVFERRHVPAADSDIPAMVFFVTDGDNDHDDIAAAAKAFQDAQDVPLYFSLIGVGSSSFNFLKKMADDLPNVGFVNLSTLDISDEELYDAIITEEFCAWVAKT